MALMFDARIPVVFGTPADVREGDAFLGGELDATLGHVAGCACCISRTPAAKALGRLFVRRARGEMAFFHRVLVVSDAAGQAAFTAALASDPVASARFRLA